MALDLVYLMGLDTAEFRAELAKMQGTAGTAMGRLGQIVEARTHGFQKMVAAVSAVRGAIATAFGIFGAVTGAISLGVSLVQSMTMESDELLKRAKEEAETRKGITRSIVEARLALARANREGRRAFELEEELRRLDMLERQADILSKIEEIQLRMRTSGGPFRSNESELLKFYDNNPAFTPSDKTAEVLARLRAERAEVARLRTMLVELTESYRKAAEARRRAFEDDVARRAEDFGFRGEIAGAQRRGDDDLLNRLRLRQRELQLTRELQALREAGANIPDGEKLIQEQLQLETQEIARQKAERERVARLAQQQRDLDEKSLQVDLLRAQGKSTQAAALERRLELERRLAQVANDAEMSAEQRLRIEKMLRDVYAAQEKLLAAQAARRKRNESEDLEVELLRARGLDKQADALERRYELERRIQEIQDRDDLTQAEKDDRERTLRQIYAARDARDRAERLARETIDPGRGASQALRNLVFGPYGSRPVTHDPNLQSRNKLRASVESLDGTMQAVNETMRRGVTALFA